MLSAAQADTTTEPETVAPAAGDFNETIGGLVSGDVGAPTTFNPDGMHGAAADASAGASTLPSSVAPTTQMVKLTSLKMRGIRTRIRVAILWYPLG
jgi:hypothetical protein